MSAPPTPSKRRRERAGAPAPESDPILGSVQVTGAPVIGVNEHGVVSIWTSSAQELTGKRAEEMVGKPCHEAVAGLDVFGNLECMPSCAVLRMRSRGDFPKPFQMQVETKSGNRGLFWFTPVVLKNHHASSHLYVLRGGEALAAAPASPAAVPRPREAQEPADGPDCQDYVTAREAEVLRLLARGASTQAIAKALLISKSTVRNHIQGILRKLGAHTRLEAVAEAKNRGLV